MKVDSVCQALVKMIADGWNVFMLVNSINLINLV